MAVIEEHPRQSEMCIYIGEASPFGTPNRTLKVADKYVGLVIGKQSETIKNIATVSLILSGHMVKGWVSFQVSQCQQV